MTIPGANIILDTNDRIGFGVYADIFRPSEGVLVYIRKINKTDIFS